MVAHYGDMELARKDEEGVRAFYRKIPSAGGRENSIGPVLLRDSLGIEQEEFDRHKSKLQEHELIGTVQGGGIYRLPRGEHNEIYYYEPIRRELELYWAEQPKREYHRRQRFLRVLDTHHRGRGRDGRWARPDLTLLGGKVLPYLPGKFLDVVTFEVKLGMPVEGLYEALAHRRRANFAYIICICPEHWGPPSPTEQATIVAEATRQGVGVILVLQEDDFALWQELVEPIRHETDPQQLHDFLETQCDRVGSLDALREWLQRDAFELPPVTDDDLRRLNLTTDELTAARTLVERIADSEESWGPTWLQDIADNETLASVKATLKSAGLIETVQGGGVKRASSAL